MASEIREVKYSIQNMIKCSDTPHLDLPDIVEEACYSPRDRAPYMLFVCKEAEWPARERVCRHCNARTNISVHGEINTPRLIHDVNVGVKQVDIQLTSTRYRCAKCGRTFNRELPSVLRNRQMTCRLYEQIKRDAFIYPFVTVASMYGYSDTTIANIFDEYAAEPEKSRGTIVAPKVLGIDEKHIVNAMRAIFVDIETGHLLEMTSDNKAKNIIETIESMVDYDKNIELVTMDMANGYRSYVQECLPRAKIIVDKYHVYQDLYQKVARTRTKIMDVIRDRIDQEPDATKKLHLRDVRDLVLKNSYLFKFGQAKLKEKQSRIAAMADVCATFPEFNHLRLLKEGFEMVYDHSDRKEAEDTYQRWLELVPPVGSQKTAAWEARYHVSAELFSEFRTFANAVNRWYTEVFNYFDPGCSKTNAASEGLNQLIGRINQNGNGYSFTRLRAKALFWQLASPRIKYSIQTRRRLNDTKSTPRKQFDNNDTDDVLISRLWTGFNYSASYETEHYIGQESLGCTHKQISVYYYLPKYEDVDEDIEE